ncbi:MAG: type I secretion system permease/ATPase [Rhodobacteraceae bacterium]|jgi:ATP-binding cassette subfamily C protein|nr:type I secretion system permease/ATPase [Paracoccaceae bacterium]
MSPESDLRGRAELAAARRGVRALIWAAALFSVFVNLLMLTGPIYMLQVYDRVLGSRSEATLVALTLIVVYLYGLMAILDLARGRLMTRAAARLKMALEARVFRAVLRRSAVLGERSGGQPGTLRDLDAVWRMVASPALAALFDLPWTPIFLAGIFLFHPWLGWLAVGGGALLMAFTLANQSLTRRPVAEAAQVGDAAERMGEQLRSEAETVQSLGMSGAVFARWEALRARAMGAQLAGTDRGGLFGAGTKAVRLFLQSAMLGLGAFLVLRGELSAGAMIAASILMGRALAPVEQAIGGWDAIHRGQQGWRALARLLGEVPPDHRRTAMPVPEARLVADNLSVVPPGEKIATLRMVSFTLEPGQALGVIGQSGSGKTTLARAVTGVWGAAAGRLRLGGVPVEQYDPDRLGRLIGHLPQRVTLFDGTIAENIARFDPQARDEDIVRAAQRAAAHEMIVAFPDGYDTRVTAAGGRLSGGQIQRIGLARALYGDPVLLVLDEPNSNLDNDGSEALNAAIRAAKADGRSVMIMAHRPAAIRECDTILILEGGLRRAFGPRDEVLMQHLQNFGEVRGFAPGGVR